MTLSGTFTFSGPRETVWSLLLDPAVLAKALPGTKTLTKTAEDRLEGVMKVSIGPVTAAEFAVVVTLKDQRAPEHFAMGIDGKGALGFVRGTASVGTTNVGFLQGEINYAEGSKSSSFEVNADSGSITFTKADAMGVHEGSITATYPMGSLMGTFHAEWCQGGQEY